MHTGTSVSYRRFPTLRAAQEAKDDLRARHPHTQPQDPSSHRNQMRRLFTKINLAVKADISDWKEFIQHPIFLSSLSISCLYLTVLSFDGTMISYLKADTYSDTIVSGMRGLSVVAGLLGTLAMPILERRVGLVRAGNWSIWYVVIRHTYKVCKLTNV